MIKYRKYKLRKFSQHKSYQQKTENTTLEKNNI